MTGNELRQEIERAAETRVRFLLARESAVRAREAELMNLRRILEIASLVTSIDMPSGDFIIRVEREKVARSSRAEISPDACSWRPIPTEG